MKQFNRPTGFAAFQPPSDMQGEGGSSRSKKVFIGLGIGCGVVLLIIGILFAAGAFKAVSCCNQVKGIAEKSMGAEQFANQFAQDIWEGNLDQAYATTSDEFQQEVSREAFGSAVEAHRDRMAANAPRMFNMQLEQEGAQQPSLEQLAQGTWLMSYQFAGPSDETMLLLNFRVKSAPADDGEKFVAADVAFDERPRNLEIEPPASEVLKVHDMIQRGQYELAYARLGDAFRSSTDRDTWRQFLDDAGPILTQSDLEIREVAYGQNNAQATIMAHARTSGGKSGIVQFELVPMQSDLPGFGWRIVTIAPMVAETQADGPDEPLPPMPSANDAGEEED